MEKIRQDVLIPYRNGDRYSVLTYRPGIMWYADHWFSERHRPYWEKPANSFISSDGSMSVMYYTSTRGAKEMDRILGEQVQNSDFIGQTIHIKEDNIDYEQEEHRAKKIDR